MITVPRADTSHFAKGTFTPVPQRSDMAKLVMSQVWLGTKLFWRHGEQMLLTIIIPLAMLIGLVMVPVFELDHPLERIFPMVLATSAMSAGFTGQAIAVGFDRRYGALKCIGASGVPLWGVIVSKIMSVYTTVTLRYILFSLVGLAPGAELLIGGWLLAYMGMLLGTFVFTSLGLLMGGTLGAELILGLANLIWFILIDAITYVAVVPSLDDISPVLLHLLPFVALTDVTFAALAMSVHWSAVGVLIVWGVLDVALAARQFRFDMPNDQESVGEPTKKSATQRRGFAYYHFPPARVKFLSVNIADRSLPLSFLPLAPTGRQKLYALLVLTAQAAIAVTGSIIRVTGSGLGCTSQPEYHPGSFVPVAGEAEMLHQIIEFGSRLLTFMLVALTLLLLLSVVRVGCRKEIKLLAFLNGLGVIVQAVIGGISMRIDLKWYAVALHFLPPMVLVWLVGMLFIKTSEPDDGTATRMYPRYLRYLVAASGLALTMTLITGTMVASAGPHAGDASVPPEDRLQLPIVDLAHIHAGFMYLYLGLVTGLIFGLLASETFAPMHKIALVLVVFILAQDVVGMVQYWSGVPEALVPVHAAGSGIYTALTAVLFQHGYRTVGGSTVVTGSPEGDAAAATVVSEKNVEVSA